MLLFPLLLAVSGCREAFVGFGAGPRARASADQFFGSLADRHVNVTRAPRYEHARRAIMRGALSPSRVFDDTTVWTARSGDARLLETFGAFTSGRYLLTSRPGIPAPRNVADARHVTTLSKLSGNEYKWDMAVDFALGSARPADIAAVISGLIASAEGRSEREARTGLAAAAPRTSAALGTAFSLDSLRPTQLADGSTAVTLVAAVRSDLLKRRYPAFGNWVHRYIDPARYRVLLTDRAGVPYLEASARERLVTIKVRTHRGAMVALTGAARPMPDTLLMHVDLKVKIKLFNVGFHGLTMQFVNGARGDSQRDWTVTARKEPSWDLPLATARLIRAPLRRPFAGDGSMFRIGVRADSGGPTVLVRHSRLYVQESAILRFLNALGNTAMDEFRDQVEREEAAWLRELFIAMRDDARGAVPN